MLTRAGWLAALEAACAAEARPLWLPIDEVRDLGDRLFECGYRASTVRRGSLHGADARFDETLEDSPVDNSAGKGARSQWKGHVRAVLPHDQRFTLRVSEGRAPAPGDRVNIRPKAFLRGALDWLKDNPAPAVPTSELSRRLGGAPRNLRVAPTEGVTPRPRQREVLALAGRPLAVCWGPPGTGKTTTLAALVAGLARAGERVLVVAPTRVACDGACLAIDKAMGRGGRTAGDVLRVQAPQLADAFERQNPDLLLWDTEQLRFTSTLIDARKAGAAARRQLLEARGVDRDEALRRSASADETVAFLEDMWRERQEELVDQALVAVSTVRTAVDRGFAGQFTTVVVDEASMVSLSDGLLLALQQRSGAGPTGSLLLFGDPMQLGPIPPRVDADAEDAAAEEGEGRVAVDMNAWFERDVLTAVMQDVPGATEHVVMLDEQSRMNAELCAIVSERSYRGELRPTPDAPVAGWAPWLGGGVCLLDPAHAPSFLGTVSPLPRVNLAWNVVVQRESAASSVALARFLHRQGINVMLCSPYRGQATLLQRAVGDLPDLRAGTVHRLQGQEADVCIFDPAQPARWFIKDSAAAPRLVNVAASRARRAFVLSNAPAYLALNPLLAPYLGVAVEIR